MKPRFTVIEERSGEGYLHLSPFDFEPLIPGSRAQDSLRHRGSVRVMYNDDSQSAGLHPMPTRQRLAQVITEKEGGSKRRASLVTSFFLL
jgi:hypothetical protein